jgi:hypothetical protein
MLGDDSGVLCVILDALSAHFVFSLALLSMSNNNDVKAEKMFDRLSLVKSY